MAKPAAKRPARRAPAETGGSYYLLLGVVVALSLFGVVMVFSASHATALADYGDSFYFIKKQLVWMIIGFVGMFILARTDWRFVRRYALILYVITAGLLAMVLVTGYGVAANGASRWIDLGPVRFQPSEIAKFALILFAATYLARKRENIGEWREMAMPVLPAFVVMATLIMLQPDLGTTLIAAGVIFIMLLVAGARWRHLLALGGTAVGAVAVLIATEGYRLTRFTSFLNPWKDPQNSGFQIIQSLIALGSGHWFGVGLGMSKQKFFYLPAAHTDFILAIIGEEFGLLGTIAVVIAFGALAYAGVKIALRATTHFDRLIATGITAMILVQAILNMGAVSGILPITGVPLPFVSYGGTSLSFTLAAIGVLLNIASRERKSNEGIIDASDYFRGRNRRTPVSRARSSRGTRATS